MEAVKPVARLRNGARRTRWREPRRFAWTVLSPPGDAVLCATEDGAFYALPLLLFGEADGWDGSGAKGIGLIDGGRAAALSLRSGRQVVFPVDWVLHHCEPRYRFYKATCPPSAIGPRIKHLRKARGLSLSAAAAAAGMAVPNWCRVERGALTPSLGTLRRAARAVGVSLGEILAARRAYVRAGRRSRATSKRLKTDVLNRAVTCPPPAPK